MTALPRKRLPKVVRHAPAESRADAWSCDFCGRTREPCDGDSGWCEHRGMASDDMCETCCQSARGAL